jgi:hypothetical protein
MLFAHLEIQMQTEPEFGPNNNSIEASIIFDKLVDRIKDLIPSKVNTIFLCSASKGYDMWAAWRQEIWRFPPNVVRSLWHIEIPGRAPGTSDTFIVVSPYPPVIFAGCQRIIGCIGEH